MDFKSKVDKILEIRRMKLWKLAEISDLGSTLEKAYEENREMRSTTTDKFLQNIGVNREWWDYQTGEVFDDRAASKIYDTLSPKEDRLITTLELAVDYLGKHNQSLLKIVEDLTGKIPTPNQSK